MTTETDLNIALELDKAGDIGLFEQMLKESITTVEQELNLEDVGWLKLGTTSKTVLTEQQVKDTIEASRTYAMRDPLGRQALRIWTDYTFGTGMTWSVKEENKRTGEVLESFWRNRANRSVLSAAGQRVSSDTLLMDGKIYFALFLGANGEVKIRRIDRMEITETITNPEDAAEVMYYKRQYTDQQYTFRDAIYRSWTNPKGEPARDRVGTDITVKDGPLVYEMSYNHGYPLLTPAIEWIKQYRRFLASRVAIVLALARFAWHTKQLKGTSATVAATKAQVNESIPDAASWLVENAGSETTPIKTDTGAAGAYQDGRMLKLQIAAATGIPEQYFGDISIGNLATAKTVELPMMKMFQSYQQVWRDAYRDIDDIVLEFNDVPEKDRYVDMDFPPIAPEDVQQAADSLSKIIDKFPDFANLEDVQQVALMVLGINDTAEVLKGLNGMEEVDVNVALAKALRRFKEVVENGHLSRV